MVGVTDEGCTFYQWLDTLWDNNQSLSHFEWFRYDFSGYEGEGTRIAIAHLLTGAEVTLIDDITVTEATGCVPPIGLEATNLRHADSIVVRWENRSGATLFQVAWDTITRSFSALTGLGTTADTFYRLPPLQAGGKYSCYVRAMCDGGQSAWRSIDFAAGSVVMPFATNDTVVGCNWVIYDNGGAMRNYENSSSSLLIVRPADSGHVVAFLGGTIDLVPWGGDTLEVYEGEGTEGALLYSIGSTYEAERVSGSWVSEDGALTFRFVSDGYGTASGYELFTSCVEAPACRRPRNVAATAVSSHSAEVSWAGGAINYDVTYRTVNGGGAWQTVNVSGNNATLTALTAGETYELYVKGYCTGGEMSPASATIRFSTLCETYTIAPGYTVEESFEENEAPARCFSLLQSDGNPNEMIHSTERAFVGNRSFRFSSYYPSSNYNQILVSPPLSSADSIYLRFRYSDQLYGGEQLRVGYSLTGNGPEDFVWTDTLTTSGIIWKRYNSDFPVGTRFVAINYCSQLRYYAYVDSLYIGVVPSADCQAPNITHITESAESIAVDFVATGSVEAYITTSPWSDNVNGVTVSGSRHTFRGLQPNTEYTIGLRSHCSGGISSHWTTRRVTTSTEGCPAPTTFVLDDVGYSTATFSWNGAADSWELHVMGDDFDQWYTAEEMPFVVTGLPTGGSFNARIRSLCDGRTGEWCDSVIVFSTLGCAPVSGLESHVVSVENGVVDILWQGSADSYVLEYGVEHFPAGEGTAVHNITTPHYRLTGLQQGVAYDYYVKSQCDSTTSSPWSERGRFVVSNEGVDTPQEGVGAQLFPNPATGSTLLELTGVQGKVEVDVIDLHGRVLQQKVVKCGENCRVRLELGKIPQGAYFVRIVSGKMNIVRKLVVR